MTINHELWRVVASGLLDAMLADMVAVTDRDARHRLWREYGNAFLGKLALDGYSTLAYIVSAETLGLCWDHIVDPTYNPSIQENVARPVNAAVSGGDTLVCDDPGEGFVPTVFSWDFTVFTELGPLSANATPGIGFYVIAIRDENRGIDSLPSAFLETTS
jgi:hypothetical protein